MTCVVQVNHTYIEYRGTDLALRREVMGWFPVPKRKKWTVTDSDPRRDRYNGPRYDVRQDGAYPQFADKYYIRNHEYVLSCLKNMTADRFKRVIKIEKMGGGQSMHVTVGR